MAQLQSICNQLVCLLVIVLAANTADAESFESLLMPGPVTTAHEKYEMECEQCHDTTSKDKQPRLCVQCHAHENILDDLSSKSGFHGRLSKPERTDCKHCHAEHEGRDANLVLLNFSTFNHQKTDFELKGAHEKTSCAACHKKDKKYSEASSVCYSCHKDSDVHEGEQGKKCESCHKETSWKDKEFDHDKTDFALKGKHEETSCSSCHINNKYKDTPVTCVSCHQVDDAHGGEFGKKCETCHNSEKWNEVKFDHNKKTDFPLYGTHKTATCNSCHISGGAKKELPTKCFGCHKNDDSHKGRYGEKCNDCHKNSSWDEQKFNHDKKTDFPLIGEHKKTACNQCHKGDLYKDELTSKCIDCHKKDDVHKGNQGEKCDSCHNEKGWHSNVLFDHDLASFPLIGMHAATQCEECHLTAEYEEAESGCNQCHADVDVHKTQLGTDCETCHTSNSWYTWFFDHDKDSDFKIDGAHKELGCYDCHKTKSKGKLEAAKDCISCHRSDDVHNRQFGRQCGDCHSTKDFKAINIKQKW